MTDDDTFPSGIFADDLSTLTDALREEIAEHVDGRILDDRRDGSDVTMPVLIVRSEPIVIREIVERYADKITCDVAVHPADCHLIPVESSNMYSIGYNDPLGVLYVRFDGTDGTYLYFDVDLETYRELAKADSHGSYFHEHIKGAYPCVLVD